MQKGIRRLVCASLIAVLTACGSGRVAPGFYRVERSDTVSKIARENRTMVANIKRWNGLANPDAIEVGQVLRIAPPAGAPTAVNASGSATPGSAKSDASAQALAQSTPGRASRSSGRLRAA